MQTTTATRTHSIIVHYPHHTHKGRYRTYLQKYLAFHGMKNITELLVKGHKEIESQIIDFIITSKEKGMKRVAISNYTCPVISFCKINDIMLNTMKINKFMPPQVKSKKTFA